MTMTNEEICRDYKAAKAPSKQIAILAELNQCSREKIKQILVEGGCKLPGNCVGTKTKSKGVPLAGPPAKTDDNPQKPTKLPGAKNDDDAYQELMAPYKRVKVLYLDDLFKTGKGQEPTTADCNLAFELLNTRYADPDKLTIISSERTMGNLLDIDEAIGSRIYERSKAHYVDLSGRKNWRLT